MGKRNPGSQVGGPCSQWAGHVGVLHPGLSPGVQDRGVCVEWPQSNEGRSEANTPKGKTGSRKELVKPARGWDTSMSNVDFL